MERVTVRTPLLVVFSAQRTGSNHLFDLLAAREGVASLNEVFNGVTLGLTDEVKALRKLRNPRNLRSLLDYME